MFNGKISPFEAPEAETKRVVEAVTVGCDDGLVVIVWRFHLRMPSVLV